MTRHKVCIDTVTRPDCVTTLAARLIYNDGNTSLHMRHMRHIMDSTAAATPQEPIWFDPVSKHFRRGQASIPGLLGLLQARFYSHYSYTAAKYNLGESNQTEYQRRQAKKKITKVDSRAKGQATGVRLDKEITKTVDVYLQFQQLGTVTFADKKALKKAVLPPWAKEDCTKLLPQTYAFWEAITALKLRPVNTQVIVEDNYRGLHHYATAVDVVCIDKHGEYTIIEVKCGFTGYYKRCTKHVMSAPLNGLTDSLKNQHQLQLAANVQMYKKKYPDRTVSRALILHIEGTQVSQYSLKPWAKAVKSWPKLLFGKS